MYQQQPRLTPGPQPWVQTLAICRAGSVMIAKHTSPPSPSLCLLIYAWLAFASFTRFWRHLNLLYIASLELTAVTLQQSSDPPTKQSSVPWEEYPPPNKNNMGELWINIHMCQLEFKASNLVVIQQINYHLPFYCKYKLLLPEKCSSSPARYFSITGSRRAGKD